MIGEPATFNGYHVFAVDETTVNIARNPDSPSFVKHKGAPNGYNQLHATVLFDVINKLYLDCFLQDQPTNDEIAALLAMSPWNSFPEKSVIVADRGFESYNLFAHFIEREHMKFLVRIKQKKTAMKIIRHLPMQELDEDVCGEITTTQTREDKEHDRIFIQTHANPDRTYSGNTRAGKWDFPSPYSMKFRVVRIKLDTDEYETLATNLPREEFTSDDLRELYHTRWGIETAFRELKYGLGLVNLHGRSEDFVRQEIYAAFTMANFCSRIVSQVALENRKNAKYAYAVDMKMAINLIKQYLRNPSANGNNPYTRSPHIPSLSAWEGATKGRFSRNHSVDVPIGYGHNISEKRAFIGWLGQKCAVIPEFIYTFMKIFIQQIFSVYEKIGI